MQIHLRRILPATIIVASFATACFAVNKPCLAASKQEYIEETRLGLSALETENFAEAETHLKKAMEMAKGSKTPRYGEYTKSLINLGMLYDQKKEYNQSEVYYREVLKNYVDAFGENSLEAAVANEYLADLYRKTGKYETAISCYEKAKAVREIAAPNHPDLADTLAGLAQCKAKSSSKEQAIPLMQKVISIRETAFGRTSGKVVKSRLMLASLYEEIGKPKLAIPAYQAVIDMIGPTDKRSGAAFERLAYIHDVAGQPAKADECFKGALKARELTPGKNNVDLNNCVKLYARFLRGYNKEADAKKLEERFFATKKPTK